MSKRVIALDNVSASPHTWTKGLDYEVVEKGDFFTLASNEGQVNYVNGVRDEVMESFKGEDE